jgi:hypothetical protein
MKVVSWIITLCGLWEFGDIAALLVPEFGHIPAFLWNHIFVGLILMIAGAWAALTRKVTTARRLHWIAAVAGAWLIAATFILRPLEVAAGLLNDSLVGAIVLILGVWAALAASRVDAHK